MEPWVPQSMCVGPAWIVCGSHVNSMCTSRERTFSPGSQLPLVPVFEQDRDPESGHWRSLLEANLGPAPLPLKEFTRLWFILVVCLLQATHVSEFIHGSCRTIQRGPRAIMFIAFLAFCIVWLWLLDNASRRSLFIVFASCCYLTGCGARWVLSSGHRKKSTGLLRGCS